VIAGTSPDIFQELTGIASFSSWPDGGPCECRLDRENRIETPFGVFIPRYSRPGIRTKELKSLSFHRNGRLASIHLEEQALVKTPAGIIEAELLTFYEDGALNSVFPLNGQIGFGWTEEDEGKLAPRHSFALSVGTVSVKLNGVRFFPGGAIRSLIFWPGETALIKTPAGDFPARIGLRFYEDGALESFEPALPITLDSPAGPVPAYNTNAPGVDADFNSVRFDRAGNLVGAAASSDIVVNNPASGRIRVSSRTRPDLTCDRLFRLPLSLIFTEKTVCIDDGMDTREFPLENSKFLFLPDIDTETACGDGCASCKALCRAS
jgi:hypothetical protein